MPSAFPVYELARDMYSAATFHARVASAAASRGAFGKCLHLYSECEYAAMRLFLDGDGLAGFALDGGRIVSMFCHADRPAKGVSVPLLNLAVGQGGNRLDAFDTVLPALYAGAGFKTVARMRWDDRYAPDGWCYEGLADFSGGRPDVVFMVYTKGYCSESLVGSYPAGVAAQLAGLNMHQVVEVRP